MTTGQAPHKEIEADPGGDVRLAMTRLAAAEDPRFHACGLEVERGGPSYAFETLGELAELEGDSELVFLMGADAALGLEGWREPRRVLELATLGIAGRNGSGEEEVREVLDRLGAADRATTVDMPPFSISSSTVRRRAAEGRPLRWLVPDPVAAFIEERGLYR